MQRVGFDRIDFAFRTPAPENFAADAEQQAAEQGHRDCQDRIEGESRREAFAGLQMKQLLMQKVDAGAHRGDDQADENCADASESGRIRHCQRAVVDKDDG